MKVATRKRLEKAERAIGTAQALLDLPDTEAAVGRAYYAMFYAAEALLGEEGLKFAKHSGVHGAFGQHFAKTGKLDPKFHKWLLAAFKKRVVADYGIEETRRNSSKPCGAFWRTRRDGDARRRPPRAGHVPGRVLEGPRREPAGRPSRPPVFAAPGAATARQALASATRAARRSCARG